jgi:PIN domain nuclease of toxin-antitoxin system
MLLLDTHIWLWALLEPERISASVEEALTANDKELWLSPVSVWEATLLAERGRIKAGSDTEVWVSSMVAALPCREAKLTHEIALASRSLTLAHQDPADRFIAGTARVLELTLVTADERLLGSTEFAVMASR